VAGITGIRTLADKEAESETKYKKLPKVIGWIVGIITILPFSNFWDFHLRKQYGEYSCLIVLAAMIITGIIAASIVRSIMRNRIRNNFMSAREKELSGEFEYISREINWFYRRK